LFSETTARRFSRIAAPIERQKFARDVAMKGAIRPVASARDEPVLYRIEVNVVDMARKIGLVADCVLPIAPLPYSLFPLSAFARAPVRIGRQTAGEVVLDQAPAAGKIRIVYGQRPDGVQVIGQHADRDCLKRIALLRPSVGVAQPPDMAHEQIGRAGGERHGGEKPSSFDPYSMILRHKSMLLFCYSNVHVYFYLLLLFVEPTSAPMVVGTRLRRLAHPTETRVYL